LPDLERVHHSYGRSLLPTAHLSVSSSACYAWMAAPFDGALVVGSQRRPPGPPLATPSFRIDLKGSTHHPGLLKVLISGNKCGPAAVEAQRRGRWCALSRGLSFAGDRSCRGVSGSALRRRLAQDLREALGRRDPSQRLSRSTVKLRRDAVELGLGDRTEVRALGEVLAKEPVCVLV
jgi:hypothetical protein